MAYSLNQSLRLHKARLNSALGNWVVYVLEIISLGLTGLAVFQLATGSRLGWSWLGLALVGFILFAWIKWDLRQLPAQTPETASGELDQLLPADLAARIPWPCTQAQLWNIIQNHWRARFIMIRIGLPPDQITAGLSVSVNPDEPWATAQALAAQAKLASTDEGALTAAIITTNPALVNALTARKVTPNDVVSCLDWLGRIERQGQHEQRSFGGIGRDWASGFTPNLDHFGTNYSNNIDRGGYRYETLGQSEAVKALITTMSGHPGAVVVTGPIGVGKTALVYALAERLLEGAGGSLAYRQVVGLNASLILASSKQPGDIEHLMLTLMGEAIAAGNIVLALDEAQLFFGSGTGAVDLSQILLPVLQSRRLDLILTMTPDNWQRLSAANPTMATQISRVNMNEPPEAEVYRLLEDASAGLEARSHLIVTYQSLKATYRLSGRYNTDEAYPGRALKLLEAAMGQPDGPIITEASVERAIEATYGVKAGTASGAESATLLQLEDQIHQRMINQSRAVTVVANALRRARAGVANPKRPIGSFLFLGPTGVGKTELARSLAAVYFKDEANMVRLDMSEYQRPDDVARILADTGSVGSSLLLSIRQRPFSVVLLDEIEKAHPDILNLFLQLLDEGQLTDVGGRTISFKDTIVIATSNAGADEIRTHIAAGENLESFEKPFIDNLISSGSFKPELLNRFDAIVLFRPLNASELAQVVGLMINEVNRTLAPQQLSVELTPAAITKLVEQGNDPRLGARPMRRAVQSLVEDVVAGRVLRGQAGPGTVIQLDAADLGVTQQ